MYFKKFVLFYFQIVTVHVWRKRSNREINFSNDDRKRHQIPEEISQVFSERRTSSEHLLARYSTLFPSGSTQRKPVNRISMTIERRLQFIERDKGVFMHRKNEYDMCGVEGDYTQLFVANGALVTVNGCLIGLETANA